MTSTEIPLTTAETAVGAPVVPVRGRGPEGHGLLDAEGRDDLRLRVAVQPGGCAGMQYQLFFDERTLDGDVGSTSPSRASGVVVDRTSVPLLAGATISFADTIEKQGFAIDNPNAAAAAPAATPS